MLNTLTLVAGAIAVLSIVALVLTRRRHRERMDVLRQVASGGLAFSLVALAVLWLPEITPTGGDGSEGGLGGIPVGLWPVVIGLALYLLYVLFVRRLLERASSPGYRVQLWKLAAGLTSVVLIVLVISDPDWRGQVLTFLGLLIGAIITLSSTTLVANALAGFMLKVIRNFDFGDRIQIGEYYGGVTELGLFHVEIQTEDMNLVTLPNTLIVTQPVTVVGSRSNEKERKDGERVQSHTWIHADVSLGYDLDPDRISDRLNHAARESGLTRPRVRILELGDFSVVYRIRGLLRDVRGNSAKNQGRLFSAPSRLREEVIRALHADGIEIVSPTVMTTRAFAQDHQFLSSPTRRTRLVEVEDTDVLPKADEMQRVDETRKEAEAVVEKAAEKLKDVQDKDVKKEVEETVADLAEAKKELSAILADPDADPEISDSNLEQLAAEAAERVRRLEAKLEEKLGDEPSEPNEG